MCIEVDTAPYISSERRQRNAQEELRVYDTPNDDGWHVYGDWDSFPNASRWYRLYILPANDANNHYLREETDRGKRIGQFDLNQRSFTYDSILIGHSTTFTLTTWDGEETDIAWVDTFSSDNLAPRDIVSGLRGRYVPDLRAILLHWEPYPTVAEPNLGGYWVCPVVEGQDENISHLSPLLRNYYLESIPGGISRIGVKVQAMDRSGQRGPWQPEYYWISIPPLVLSPWATAFNQGRHLVRLSETKALYMVYENEGKVFYRYSGDNGEYWSEEEIGYGYYPSIGVDQKGLPWVVFWREGDIVCKVKKPDGFWKEIIVYDGNNTSWAGAPAIAMGTLPKEGIIPIPQPFAYITYPVYQGEGIPEIPAPGPYPSSYNCIMLSILDKVSIVNYLIDEGDANNPVSDPAVAVTPADLLHLVWQKGGEIWYTTNYNKLSYNNWQEAQFQDKVNISESPEVLSQHPFIEAYGENVICAWKEGEPGEVYRRVRKLSSPTMAGNDWSGIENISQSPDKESDYPVLSTLDVCAYQERVDSLNYEIFAWIKGERINLSETENSSKYPHIAVEPPTVSDASGTIIIEPKIIIDAIWTEKLSDSLYYEVRFKRYEYNPSSPPTEYISVAIGESIPSLIANRGME